jgi:hypothetical protein
VATAVSVPAPLAAVVPAEAVVVSAPLTVVADSAEVAGAGELPQADKAKAIHAKPLATTSRERRDVRIRKCSTLTPQREHWPTLGMWSTPLLRLSPHSYDAQNIG